jgi:lipopolysaccharide biosynthesis protein
VAPERFRLDYYGGTMFWVRPEALKPLRDLRLARCFVDDGARVDGGLEHVVERLFSTAAVVAGYELADSDGREVTHGA